MIYSSRILTLTFAVLIFSVLIISRSVAQTTLSSHSGIYGVVGQPVSPQFEQSFVSQVQYEGVIVERYKPSSQMINGFKVFGSPYLFSVPVKSNIFSVNGAGYNVFTGYNLYDQNLEIFQGEVSLGKLMIKNIGEIDSFTLVDVNTSEGLKKSMNFINSKFVSSTKKLFLQKIYAGDSFSLWKSYKMILENANADYGITGVKDFVLLQDYYYTCKQNRDLKKLKLTTAALKKEFLIYKNASSMLAVESEIDENFLITLFSAINSN